MSRVTILQIGDSHTAADSFSGRLRELFQSEFGSAGRGQLAPGVPTPLWRPSQVRAEQLGKWQVLSSNQNDFERVRYGLSGYVVRGLEKGSTMSLSQAGGATRIGSVVVGYYHKRNGGSFEVSLDGKLITTIATNGTDERYVRKTIAVEAETAERLEITLLGDGEVDFGEWGLYSGAPGVEFINHGFVGAQVSLLERWDQEVVAQQLRDLDPALILLAFGTNEGFAAKERLRDYESRLEARVAALQKDAPNAAIALIAAPDANRLPKYCGLSPEAAALAPCRPLSDAESRTYDLLLSRKDNQLCRWHTPASYAIIRGAQQRVAYRRSVYWWDWFAAQGGACAASTWYREGLAQKDHVHLKREGAMISADRLYAALMGGSAARQEPKAR